jgi:DNA-nicking Smr family endonuclease
MPEEVRLWSIVASTVHPLSGRKPLIGVSAPIPNQDALAPPLRIAPAITPSRPRDARAVDEKVIEPRRKHRIAKERELIGARIDLHGMTQDGAQAALEGFLFRAWDEGYRAVLVITGKGVQGDGVLRRRAPEWLGAASLAHIVAGISEAHRRHGGDGALYVALKRKGRGAP